ncbi:hypothetical protein FI667_g8798, partial [Globisporangium splendens]
MEPTALLERYSSGSDAPKHSEVHVLVELPADIRTPAEEQRLLFMEAKLDAIYNKLVVNDSKECKRYCPSDMDNELGPRLLQMLGIMRVRHKWTDPLDPMSPTTVQAFDWNGSPYVDTKVAHRVYLCRHLADVLEEVHLCVCSGVDGIIDDENGSTILKASVRGHAIDLEVRADLLIADNDVDEFEEEIDFLPCVQMAINVLTPGATAVSEETCRSYETMLTLLVLELLTPVPVMVVLTNLSNFWRFYWTSENEIHSTLLRQPPSAFELMRQTLQAGASASQPLLEDVIPLENGLEIKRKKLKLRMPCDGNAVGDEPDVLRELIERFYDLEDVLGSDIAMAREIGRIVARSMPMYRPELEDS